MLALWVTGWKTIQMEEMDVQDIAYHEVGHAIVAAALGILRNVSNLVQRGIPCGNRGKIGKTPELDNPS